MSQSPSDEKISLQKTLCALRWITLMKSDFILARLIEKNMELVLSHVTP